MVLILPSYLLILLSSLLAIGSFLPGKNTVQIDTVAAFQSTFMLGSHCLRLYHS